MSVPLKFTLKIGKTFQDLFLPNEYYLTVLHPAIPKTRVPEMDILKYRLQNPIKSAPLRSILSSDDRVLIIVPDKTRVARLDILFPFLLSLFAERKIPDSRVTILFANGSHPAMSQEEVKQILGEAVFRRIRHVQHDCHQDDFADFGTTKRGTRILLNSLVKQHSKIVVVGSVVHHYFAGFGGGAKMIFPGIAAYESIQHNHRLAVDAEETPLHPACRPGNIENNPVYEDLAEAAHKLPVDFAIQAVLDENNELIDAFCGDLFESFARARQRVHHLNAVPLKSQADLIIASAGGYPKDLNLIQAHKGIHHSVQALKKGGILIYLADASDGLGNPDLYKWFEDYPNYNEMTTAVRNQYRLNGNTALSLKHKLDTYKIFLISSMDKRTTKSMGFYPFDSVQEAFATAQKMLPPKALVYIIPNASIVLPEVV